MYSFQLFSSTGQHEKKATENFKDYRLLVYGWYCFDQVLVLHSHGILKLGDRA